MPLGNGERAPDFRLRGIDNDHWILGEPDQRRSVLLAFFRREVATCRLMLPFIERLHRRARARQAEIIGISLDSQCDTLEFAQDYSLTFPILIDGPDLGTCRAYRVERLPTTYRLDATLHVADSVVGWSREGFERLARGYLEDVGALLLSPWEASDEPPEIGDASPILKLMPRVTST